MALVVGADRGVGRAAAAFFARAGAAVVLAGRDAGAIEGLAHDLAALGASAMPASLDPRDRAQGAELVARALERFGQLDQVVLFGDAEGVLAAAAPRLAERGRGHVVLVAAPDAEAATPQGAARAEPLAAAARRLADEGRAHGVVVTLVRPGPVADDLGLAAGPDRLRPEDVAQAVLSLVTFAPGVRPAELVLVPVAGVPAPGSAPPDPFAV